MSRKVVEKKVSIDLVENPIEIRYDEVPVYTKEDYEERVNNVLAMAEERGYSHTIVYGDREHFSNIFYLTGLDPRFEEVLLILQKGRKPIMVLGIECLDYSHRITLDIERVLYTPFGLMGQPSHSDLTLLDIFKDSGINEDSLVGIVGWKYYNDSHQTIANSILDIPNYIVETLCQLTARENLVNAVDIFASNEFGLRHNVSAKEIVNFELNGTKMSRSVYNAIINLEEGMTEIEASGFLNIDGEPTSIHPNVNFGDVNTSYGVAGPTYHQKLQIGDTCGVGMAYRGSLVHKAGVYINSPED